MSHGYPHFDRWPVWLQAVLLIPTFGLLLCLALFLYGGLFAFCKLGYDCVLRWMR